MDTVTLITSEDVLLCPVRAAAAIVRRIKSCPGCSINSPISTVLNRGFIEHVMSQHMIDALRDAASAIGEVKLGIKKEDIGHALDEIGCSHGNVPRGVPCFYDNADRLLVQRRIPTLHQETSDGIQPKLGKENALLPKLQARTQRTHAGLTG
jgi:hypothetical protein